MNNNNITKHASHIDVKTRESRHKHRGCAIWITGLSGSGKSTLAFAVEKELFDRGYLSYVLDGDNLRSGLCSNLGFDPQSRSENIRRTAETAKLFKDAGLITIVAVISPLEIDRENAKKIIGQENFIEIFCNAPIEICEDRDIKGLYKKARSGLLLNFTGISSPYQAPKNPSLIIDSSKTNVKSSVEMVLNYLLKKIL